MVCLRASLMIQLVKKSTCSAGDVGSIPEIGHNVSGLYQVKGIVI